MASRRSLQTGFTIVELLISIVVIGILAAIVVVSYQGIQGRAHDAALASDLKNVSTQLEIFRATEGYYPGSNYFEEEGIKFTRSSYDSSVYNLIYYTGETSEGGTSYALLGQSKSGNRLYITPESGQTKEFDGPWYYGSGDFDLFNHLMGMLDLGNSELSTLMDPEE